MGQPSAISITPEDWLRGARPDHPVAFFDPSTLAQTARQFQSGFPGQVTYAVKANPAKAVLRALVRAGVSAFDVASPQEIAAVRDVLGHAALHYHNPVRSDAEIRLGTEAGVVSWSVDRPQELAKLTGLPTGTEIAVRLALPVAGAAYDFGAKFGASPDAAQALLRQVVDMGFTPSMTFHPGTQCDAPEAWARYIKVCAEVARGAGVCLHRLNVGGGFAAHRANTPPDLSFTFARIAEETRTHFGPGAPALVCEPGRAMVAETVTLALRVKAASKDSVFLNDGIYGALADWRDMGAMERIRVMGPDGETRSRKCSKRVLFGPTCDSLDRVPGRVALPHDLCAGDYLIIRGMGAYASAMSTRFNGYGGVEDVIMEGAMDVRSGHRRMAV